MKKIPGVVLTAIALLVIGKLWLGFHDKAVRAEAAQRQQDVVLDSVIRARKAETTADSLRLGHERDSTGRVIANLRSRIAGGRPATPQAPITSGADSATLAADEAASAPLLLRDSLIAAYEAGRQQDSLQLLFWQGVVASRDSTIAQLRTARDNWRQRSERRWFCTAGAGVTVGLNGRGAVGPSFVCGIRI